MSLGGIIKGTFKVAGSAGLLVAAGVAKAASRVTDQYGGDGEGLNNLGDGCLDLMSKMWTGKENVVELSESEEDEKIRARIEQKMRAIQSGISQYKKMQREAKENGDINRYDVLQERIDELESQWIELENEKNYV